MIKDCGKRVYVGTYMAKFKATKCINCPKIKRGCHTSCKKYKNVQQVYYDFMQENGAVQKIREYDLLSLRTTVSSSRKSSEITEYIPSTVKSTYINTVNAM